MAASSIIPTVDLSSFLTAPGSTCDGDGNRKKIKETIRAACSDHGVFLIVNHGMPLDLMSRAMELSKTFFEYSDEEKLKCRPAVDAPLPAGYNTYSECSHVKKEYLLMFSPAGSVKNTFPINPPQFQEIYKEMFTDFNNLSNVIQDILNDCLGLPPNCLKEYNNDRSSDFMAAFHYLTDTEVGKAEHEDGNLFTLALQDTVGGLQVDRNGEWIPVPPVQATLAVIISDVLQVLSNDKFKSATHRVVKPKGMDRHSYSFYVNLNGDQWVEPLPHFTTEIGEPPKYRGFVHKEYIKLKLLDKINSSIDDRVRISHYAIST